jgi:transposase
MADGLSVYESLAKRGAGLTVANCWAHVRRKFIECEDFFPEAKHAIKLIGELYAVERLCLTGPPGDEQRAALRAQHSRAVVSRLQAWAVSTRALPQSGLGKAIAYMGGLWTGLTRFLDDARIPLDNNATERALRGVVLGRKNHYGSRSRRGTEVAALFYSLLESAKLAGIEPKAYLRRRRPRRAPRRAEPAPARAHRHRRRLTPRQAAITSTPARHDAARRDGMKRLGMMVGASRKRASGVGRWSTSALTCTSGTVRSAS